MIKVTGIEKSYNSEKVLKGIDLTIEKGEFVSIMGESGSGKSTLINIMGGFLPADNGKVFWDDKDINLLSEKEISNIRCTDMGFVFQSFKLVSTLTAKENVMLPVMLGGRVGEQTNEFIAQMIERLNLTEVMNKFPEQLSGGQCQRVALVRALGYMPKTIILDEPTGALDRVMEEKVMDLLTEINKKYGTTIIQVTHSAKVAGYGNRIIRVKDGNIV